MKILKYLLICVLVLASCKTKKYTMGTAVIAKEMAAKKVAKKHIANNFDKKTINAKFKVNFNNGKINQSISVYMKIEKDKVIWLKGTKFISVFKAKITPTSVQFYSPLKKQYFDGDFTMLEKLLGTQINFKQLQNLFLGQAILNLKEEKLEVNIVNNSYVLNPEVQSILFDAFFNIHPGHFKLNSQSIVNSAKEQRLDILYPSYTVVDEVVFPQEIKIKAKDKKKFTQIDFELKSVEFNTVINTSFSIPNGYKRIEL
ncbi:DUF4292 domain-containing protein [Polaribacter cellanae]|uniref:DUF4292 domain-containing protein n=1 Tax=Polaribacter cellanae TaxID=2818493 RepID=A0A975CLP9_9FLAO|nr:DUF4292 domain-containing protein [Polaribacter cellanae]QTE21520.1 DUF4292 domain-containing protein [Polaribacter cellanae]